MRGWCRGVDGPIACRSKLRYGDAAGPSTVAPFFQALIRFGWAQAPSPSEGGDHGCWTLSFFVADIIADQGILRPPLQMDRHPSAARLNHGSEPWMVLCLDFFSGGARRRAAAVLRTIARRSIVGATDRSGHFGNRPVSCTRSQALSHSHGVEICQASIIRAVVSFCERHRALRCGGVRS